MTAEEPTDADSPRWRPLAAKDRRVLGVLIEKAKTTPDQYPMSVNAIRSGVNQKNNRYPLMELELEDIEESLARLRAAGVVTEVQGGGRVPRFRHHSYDWLGVDKVELAVMAELLLRGAQTEGELRGRAARMEPIADVAALRPILQSLESKSLIISLTPQGRGHMLSHALYEQRELDKVRAEAHSAIAAGEVDRASSGPQARHEQPPAASSPQAPHKAVPAGDSDEVRQLRSEVADLREQLAAIRKDVDDLWSNFR